MTRWQVRKYPKYWDFTHKIKSPRKTTTLNPLANKKRERWNFAQSQTSLAHSRGPRVLLRLLNPIWLVQGLLLWKAPLMRRLLKNKKTRTHWRTRKPEHIEENETKRCFVDRVPPKKRRNTKWNSWNFFRRCEWTFEWNFFKRSHKRRLRLRTVIASRYGSEFWKAS